MLFQNTMKLLQKYGMNFLNGLGTTLLLALISVAIGCVIGALVAILRLGKSKVLRAVATVYTEVIRGNYGTAAALSTIMTILTVISLLAFSKLNGGKDISL